MKFKKVFILITLLFSVLQAFPQGGGTGPKEKSFKSERKQRKLDRQEARERRRKERAERKAVKAYHKRLQTKQVRKRMKRNRHKATLHNENRREFFIIRWFKKKKKV